MSEIKKIAVLTGGGDCPGLNAVIRSVTKAAIFDYGMEVVGIQDGYEGLVEGRVRPLTGPDVSGIMFQGGTILGTSNTANPFDYAEQDDQGDWSSSDRSQDALKTLKQNNVDGLVVIGGDGTQKSGLAFSKLGLPVVGVPKTIDNDLDATDITFGFDSALAIATDAVDRLHTTGDSHRRLMLLEVMGRYAGWIALRSGMAGGGDVILIPEIPYSIDKIVESIQARTNRGKRFSIIVVSEGAKPVGGEVVIREHVEGSPDPIRLGGVAEILGEQLGEITGMETRTTVLGHLQRGGTPTAYDRWLAMRYGVHAVRLLAQGKYGRMAALRGLTVTDVALEDAVNCVRQVAPDSEEVLAAKAVGTSFGD